MKKWYLVLLATLLVGCQAPAGVDVTLFGDGLLPVKLDDDWGYINENGEMKIPAAYDAAWPFIEGAAIVGSGATATLINKNGANILKRGYDGLARDVETGNVWYKIGDKYGLMDHKGEKLTEALFDTVSVSSEGLAAFRIGPNCGFVDENGKIAVAADYDSAGYFSNGLAWVEQDGKIGYVNEAGKVKIPIVYDSGNAFDQSGNAVVKLDDKYHLINKINERIIEDADGIRSSGILYAVNNDGQIKIHKKDGSQFSTLTFDYVWSFDDYSGNFELDDEDVNILFAEDGSIVHQADYDYSDFLDIYVGKTLTRSIIDMSGDDSVVYYDGGDFTVDGTIIQSARDDRFVVVRGDKCGIINRDGEVKLACLYDNLLISDDGYVLFMSDGKIGLMNDRYKTIVEATYDSVAPLFAY
jgi:hypothetical protein